MQLRESAILYISYARPVSSVLFYDNKSIVIFHLIYIHIRIYVYIYKCTSIYTEYKCARTRNRMTRYFMSNFSFCVYVYLHSRICMHTVYIYIYNFNWHIIFYHICLVKTSSRGSRTRSPIYHQITYRENVLPLFFCVFVFLTHVRTELSSLSSTKVRYCMIINVFDIVIYHNVMLYGLYLIYA